MRIMYNTVKRNRDSRRQLVKNLLRGNATIKRRVAHRPFACERAIKVRKFVPESETASVQRRDSQDMRKHSRTAVADSDMKTWMRTKAIEGLRGRRELVDKIVWYRERPAKHAVMTVNLIAHTRVTARNRLDLSRVSILMPGESVESTDAMDSTGRALLLEAAVG